MDNASCVPRSDALIRTAQEAPRRQPMPMAARDVPCALESLDVTTTRAALLGSNVFDSELMEHVDLARASLHGVRIRLGFLLALAQ